MKSDLLNKNLRFSGPEDDEESSTSEPAVDETTSDDYSEDSNADSPETTYGQEP